MDAELRWDPYDVGIFANPYPHLRRLREESPLYYNEQYDFFAVSRFEDVEKCLSNRELFSSQHGPVLEHIKRRATFPDPIFIFHDPPVHTIYRGLVTRIFTPAKMNALAGQIRAYCAKALDPLVGTGKFDFVRDLGMEMPMRVIGMLLGIPESELKDVQKRVDKKKRVTPGQPMPEPEYGSHTDGLGDYVDWRMKNPSDDLTTTLINAEFIDVHGVTRKLTRDEVITFCNLFAGAGNETTNRLIGWTGKVLAEHPDQRRQIHENRALIPQAIEELLRFEPPGGVCVARFVMEDVELHGVKVPKGSSLACLNGSANHDDRRFVDGDSFDIHRERLPHLSFGIGFHACVGNALARVEGRIALDEILNRFPEWELDMANATLIPSTTTRGWDTLPTLTH
jgi:cytochrome P450